MSTVLCRISKAAALAALWASSAFGAVIFNDNFDNETPALNANLSQWFIYRPSTDVVADNTYGIRCRGNAGNCLDLDGTMMQGVYMWTNSTFQFQAGFRYTLNLYLSGNQRNGDSDTVVIKFGGVTRTVTMTGGQPFQLVSIDVVGDGSTGKIYIDHHGTPMEFVGDNIGLILDDVSLAENPISLSQNQQNLDASQLVSNPEPGTWLLMLSGLGLCTWKARKRQAA